jgi:RNA polymerase sigma-70 factor (ECF subfamily)
VDESDYQQVVALYHDNLYRFALSLSGTPDDAAELTQETYLRLLSKGWQLRDPGKAKSWLFTTLYRIFLGWKRHETRFPHVEVTEAEHEIPPLTPTVLAKMDGETVMDSLMELEERYRAPLTLYYVQLLSYREIAEILETPVGTVMSRLSRGKELLRAKLSAKATLHRSFARGEDANVAKLTVL